MRSALLALAFIALSGGADAQSVGSLKAGMPYAEARAAVIAQGWQPDVNNVNKKPDLQQSLQDWFIRMGFTEVENCLPTGLGTCTAGFHNERGVRLYLFTSEPTVDNAMISSWCIGSNDPNCKIKSRSRAPQDRRDY